MKRLGLALQLMTRFPLRKQFNVNEEDFAACTLWFFLTSLLVGALMALVYYLFLLLEIPLLAAFLSVMVAYVFTGGLHIDGFADVCDAFFAGKSKQETLRILKDSRMGTYGVLGIVLMVGVKTILIANLGMNALPVLVATPVCGKIPLLFCAALSRYPRQNGMGKFIIEGLKFKTAFLAMGYCAAVVLLFCLLGWVDYGAAMALSLVVGVLCYLWADKKIGGATGDVLGAANEMGEAVYLLVAAVL